MLEIELNQFSDRKKLYKNTDLKINEGITVLIGPNRMRQNLCLPSNKRKISSYLSYRYSR